MRGAATATAALLVFVEMLAQGAEFFALLGDCCGKRGV